MMADDVPTPTVFRIYRHGEGIALFPTLPADFQGHCLCYQHVGQHGAADHAHVIASTRPATPGEYAELMAELSEIGYMVKPVRRLTRRMDEERRATLARLRT